MKSRSILIDHIGGRLLWMATRLIPPISHQSVISNFFSHLNVKAKTFVSNTINKESDSYRSRGFSLCVWFCFHTQRHVVSNSLASNCAKETQTEGEKERERENVGKKSSCHLFNIHLEFNYTFVPLFLISPNVSSFYQLRYINNFSATFICLWCLMLIPQRSLVALFSFSLILAENIVKYI